eukprot:3446038-Amphidinium_carterae.1
MLVATERVAERGSRIEVNIGVKEHVLARRAMEWHSAWAQWARHCTSDKQTRSESHTPPHCGCVVEGGDFSSL